MQIPLLHQQIILQTERLRELHRSVMLHASPVPAAELEVLLIEIRNLYELTLRLNRENAIQLLNEVQLAVDSILPSATKIQDGIINERAGLIGIIFSNEENKAVVNPEMPLINHFEVKTDVVNMEFSNDRKKIVADYQKIQNDSPTIGNSFSENKTIAEVIGGTETKKRVSDSLKASVDNIKSAIGLNEKFQFINKLFKGDAKRYNETIEKLSVSTTMESASNHIHQISDELNWEAEASSARLFMEIIERRFSV